MTTQPFLDAHTLGVYTLTAAALALAPGPAQALVLARTLQSGTRAGVVTSAGLEIGTLVHVVAAALGLSAVLATSATAFALVKSAGAAYLLVLGVLALRHAGRAGSASASTDAGPPPSSRRLLWHAAATGTLNPKVAVFFLAFLPQFVRPERGHVLLQFLALGLIVSALGLTADATLAVVSGRARTRVVASVRFGRWRERVTGAVLIALGLRLAFSERR